MPTIHHDEARSDFIPRVRATVLGVDPETPIEAQIVSISGNKMFLAVQEPIPPDTLLKVEAGNRFFLGEVACFRLEEGGCVLLLLIEHALLAA